jgi:hypothetical protein
MLSTRKLRLGGKEGEPGPSNSDAMSFSRRLRSAVGISISSLLLGSVAMSLAGPSALAQTSDPATPELHHYIGALHEHSAYSDGFPGSRPADYYASAKAFGLDFLISGEHSDNADLPATLNEGCIPPGNPADCAIADPETPENSLRKWEATAEQARAATTESFTAGRGFEWSSDRFGHINVYFSKNYTNAYRDGGFVSMETFWEWFARSPALGGGGDGIATFNHPGDKKIDAADPAFNWNGFEYRPAADRRMVGLEVFNGRKDFGSVRPNDAKAPFGYFVQALDKGWHVGAVAAEDKGHDPSDGDGQPDENGVPDDWGGAKWAKTVILAEDRTQRSLRAAMLDRRTYAVLDNDVRVDMDVDGADMGSRLERSTGSVVPLTADVTPGAARIEVYSNAPGKADRLLYTASGNSLSLPISVAEGEHYYFLRVVNAAGSPIAYTSPVWITGTGPEPAERGDWLAGDLHVHTTYSHDSYGGPGDDEPQLGDEESFYAWGLTTEQEFALAESRGLDYLAITDHNNVRSQSDSGFGTDSVIPIPGYENSLDGHAQMLGATKVYDKGSDAAAVNAMADELRNGPDGGVFQINHPFTGSEPYPDDADWGYGFDVVPDTIEVWNIARIFQAPLPSATNNDDGITWWEEWLNKGYQITPTGGSDSHWASTSAVQGVGSPTTWVYSEDRSKRGVLEGLRDGHTYITLGYPNQQPPGVFLEGDSDEDGSYDAMVGDTVPTGSPLRVRIEGGTPGSFVRLFTNNSEHSGHTEVFDLPVTPGTFEHAFTLPEESSWAWAEVYYEDLPAERAAICDDFFGTQTTYCRNKMSVIGMTSALYLEEDQAPTELTLSAPSSGRYSDTTEVTATLTSEGSPVAGASVELSLGSASASVLTDGTGNAATTFTLTEVPGDHEIAASFAGDNEHASSDASAPFTIQRELTTLDYTGDTSAKGDVVHMSAKLGEDDGPAIAGEQISFSVGGQTFTGATDANGIATVDGAVPNHGRSQTISVTFAGSELFSTSNDSATVTWGKTTKPVVLVSANEPSEPAGFSGGRATSSTLTPYALAAALVAAMGAGSIWFRRRALASR